MGLSELISDLSLLLSAHVIIMAVNFDDNRVNLYNIRKTCSHVEAICSCQLVMDMFLSAACDLSFSLACDNYVYILVIKMLIRHMPLFVNS